ncbi:MAG: hypothetical protein J6A01_03475 [Proteobacteria bacterium]|nr:hypothetical protein [Pseudomonadota bacterium]
MDCTANGLECVPSDEGVTCGCSNDDQCTAMDPSSPFCSPSNECVECLTDDNCDEGMVCVVEEGLCDTAPTTVIPPEPENITCTDVEEEFTCQTDKAGHSWFVVCQNGNMVTSGEPSTADCTADGSTCIMVDSEPRCGCNKDSDCSKGKCDTNWGVCKEDTPPTQQDDAECKNHENESFCGKLNGNTAAITCKSGKIDTHNTYECSGSSKYCTTTDQGVAYCTKTDPSLPTLTCKNKGNYSCQTNNDGHIWVVACENGKMKEGQDGSMDCTAAGNACVSYMYSSKHCGCDKDADCTTGKCITDDYGYGACTTASTPECSKDSDCASGKKCDGGKCVAASTPECAKDTDCPSGQKCDSGKCVAASTPECAKDTDCQSGEKCVSGKCTPQSSESCTPDGKGMSDEMTYCAKDQNTNVVCQEDGTGYAKILSKTYSNCVKMEVNHCNMQCSGTN